MYKKLTVPIWKDQYYCAVAVLINILDLGFSPTRAYKTALFSKLTFLTRYRSNGSADLSEILYELVLLLFENSIVSGYGQVKHEC